jgi:hypothetical protein
VDDRVKLVVPKIIAEALARVTTQYIIELLPIHTKSNHIERTYCWHPNHRGGCLCYDWAMIQFEPSASD